MDNNDSKQKKTEMFDANGLAVFGAQIFGLPYEADESAVHLLPVPWEVTVSYKTGAAKGPKAMYEASMQVDLYDVDYPDAWKQGIYMHKIPSLLKQKNNKLRKKAAAYIEAFSQGTLSDEYIAVLQEINTSCEEMNAWVLAECRQMLKNGKLLGLVGGDHSTPLGYITALAERHPAFGILHIDAHADLRDSYEGFTYSHASIMFNVLKIPQVEKIVQVGLRDVCDAEVQKIKSSNRRVTAFFNHEIQEAIYDGINWKIICERIIQELPKQVYISFDIDGLDPKNCPNTGTPVPGGLSYDQAVYLLRKVVESGKTIIGFDLVEVAPDKNEWDANVGARLLYKLCAFMMQSNGK
jgi:agmatinase